MIVLFQIGLVVLAILLFDTRRRLKSLEERFRDDSASPLAGMETSAPDPVTEPSRSRPSRPPPARIVPSPVAEAAAPAPSISAPPPAAPPPDVAAPSPPPPPGEPRRNWGFEELFGRELPIWAGGATLAVAGVLLVKYSIDAGLLSPAVRVSLGLLFGAALIGGGEAAQRGQARVQDPRVHQALAGAGIACLYAALLAAANLYGLIGGGGAFAAMALVTGLAMALSVRFGAPSAVLGLVGGLAAPALVSAGTPDVPLLCVYLALALGGLAALSRRQRWLWLGVAALVGGTGWSIVLILGGVLDFADTLSLGLFVLLLGLGLPALMFAGAPIARSLRAIAALAAAGQVAAIVATGGFGALQWGLYLLLSAATVWIAERERGLRLLPPIALIVGLLLAAAWPSAPAGSFAAVLAALGIMHVAGGLRRLWGDDGGPLDAGQIGGAALGSYAAILVQGFRSGAPDDLRLAAIALAIACVPAAAAWLGWRSVLRGKDARFAILALSSAALVAFAGLIGLAEWAAPVTLAAAAAVLLLLANRAGDGRIARGAVVALVLAGIALAVAPTSALEWHQLATGMTSTPAPVVLLRWAAIGAAAALFAWRSRPRLVRLISQVAAALATYGLAAQILSADWIAIAAACGMVACAEVMRRKGAAMLRPALYTSAALLFLWALMPIADWGLSAAQSLLGKPMLVTDLPATARIARQILLPAVLALLAIRRAATVLTGQETASATASFAVATGIAAHMLYKHVFHLAAPADVVVRGMAERTLWEILLVAAGYGLWRWRGTARWALIAVSVGLAHALWYSQLLYNPLWSTVSVGGLPVFNLLLPAFAVPFLALWLIERWVPALPGWAHRLFGGVRMALILLCALAMLRQYFAGTILVDRPVGEAESIGRSVTAILLAIGFLLWGIRRGRHDWRIASLILMLGAVAKVFLFDASGLTGLLRIASFLALGFSLIGVGWLYSRFLRRDEGRPTLVDNGSQIA